MNDVIKDYLGALDERASQVCGLNQGHQYIIGLFYRTLKNFQLQGYDLEILERDTKQLKGMIQCWYEQMGFEKANQFFERQAFKIYKEVVSIVHGGGSIIDDEVQEFISNGTMVGLN